MNRTVRACACVDFLAVFAMSGSSPAKAANLGTLTAITEIGNPCGTKLELDFIGTGTVVPIPGAAWLFGTGLVALFGCVRRKRAANV